MTQKNSGIIAFQSNFTLALLFNFILEIYMIGVDNRSIRWKGQRYTKFANPRNKQSKTIKFLNNNN